MQKNDTESRTKICRLGVSDGVLNAIHTADDVNRWELTEMTIANLMPRGIQACCTLDSANEVARRMLTKNQRAVPILLNRTPVGIVTARDLVTRLLAVGSDAARATATDIMTREPICIDENMSIDSAVMSMRKYGVRHLVVCHSDGTFAGMFSLEDLAEWCPIDVSGEVLRRVSEPPMKAPRAIPDDLASKQHVAA